MSTTDRVRDALVSYYYTAKWPRRLVTRMQGYRVVHQTIARGMDIRVVENARERRLRFNELDNQSVLDLARPERLVLPYMRHAVFGVALPRRLGAVLHVGLGGGTMARFVHAGFPEARQTAVEYYGEVAEIAYRFFGLPRDERLEVLVDDGLAAVERLDGAFDLAFVDAFADSESSVAHLATDRFVLAVKARLTDDGWLVKNVLGENHPERVALQLAAHFPVVGRLHVVETNQYVLMAGMTREPREMEQRARDLGARLPIDFPGLLSQVTWVKG